MQLRFGGVIVAILLSRSAGTQPGPAPAPGDWPMYRRDLMGSGYSPLTQIAINNVAKLSQVWTYSLQSDAPPAATALQTATKNAAAMLGMEKNLGAVAPGYYADIVAVEGDPLADIRAVTKNVRRVMKGGQVVVDRTHAASR